MMSAATKRLRHARTLARTVALSGRRGEHGKRNVNNVKALDLLDNVGDCHQIVLNNAVWIEGRQG